MLKSDVIKHFKSGRQAALTLTKRGERYGLSLSPQAVNQWPDIVPEKTAKLIALVTKQKIPLRAQDY